MLRVASGIYRPYNWRLWCFGFSGSFINTYVTQFKCVPLQRLFAAPYITVTLGTIVLSAHFELFIVIIKSGLAWLNVWHFQVTTWDWTRAEKSFTVYEIMCKILKVEGFDLSEASGWLWIDCFCVCRQFIIRKVINDHGKPSVVITYSSSTDF